IGTDLALQGSLTADGKQVCVHVRGSLSTLDPTVPLEPRTTEIAPVFEGGAQGVPVPFTQFIQKPRIEKLSFEKTLAIPDGGWAVLPGGRMRTGSRTEFGPPVLSRIPYINRLFKNVGCGRTTSHVLMLVTAHGLIGGAEEQAEKGACVGGCLGSG